MLHVLRRVGPAVLASLALVLTVAPARASTTVGGPFLGTSGLYDYSDSGIRDTAAGTETHWWCGDTAGHTTDTILREQYRLSDWSVTSPEQPVLQEGAAGSWDAQYTCNPTVVQGQFTNPFGDGVTYGYAMYYVGTANTSGQDNSIGAAFSQDGVSWRKYGPVLTFTDTGHGYYGYAQPNAAIVGGRVELLFEDSDAPASPGPGPVHVRNRSRTAVPSRAQTRHALGTDPVPAVTTHWYALANPDG